MSRHFVIVFFNEGNSGNWCDANSITGHSSTTTADFAPFFM